MKRGNRKDLKQRSFFISKKFKIFKKLVITER